MTTRSTHLAVVGGGPGGYAAAFLAADLGMEVTLIDDAPNPGGVCLYRGCIPSKALLHLSHTLHQLQQQAYAPMGLTTSAPHLDLPTARHWKEGLIRKLQQGIQGL